MKKGKHHVIAGWKNKTTAVMTQVLPDSLLAEQHRQTAAPGSARRRVLPRRCCVGEPPRGGAVA